MTPTERKKLLEERDARLWAKVRNGRPEGYDLPAPRRRPTDKPEAPART